MNVYIIISSLGNAGLLPKRMYEVSQERHQKGLQEHAKHSLLMSLEGLLHPAQNKYRRQQDHKLSQLHVLSSTSGTRVNTAVLDMQQWCRASDTLSLVLQLADISWNLHQAITA